MEKTKQEKKINLRLQSTRYIKLIFSFKILIETPMKISLLATILIVTMSLLLEREISKLAFIFVYNVGDGVA